MDHDSDSITSRFRVYRAGILMFGFLFHINLISLSTDGLLFFKLCYLFARLHSGSGWATSGGAFGGSKGMFADFVLGVFKHI